MKFTTLFLRARHWQLFLLLFGIPFAFQVYTVASVLTSVQEPYRYTNPDSVGLSFAGPFAFFPVMMFVMLAVFFGWFWSMGVGLHRQLPQGLKFKTTFFKISVLFPFIYMTAVSIGVGMMMNGLVDPDQDDYSPHLLATMGSVLVVLHLFALVCIFHSLYFAAKTLKSVELQRKATFRDFAGEFFLMWFFPIGIWIIQPRVNKVAKD